MEESERHGDNNEQTHRLMSDIAHNRRQSRSIYKNYNVICRKSQASSFQSQTSVMRRISSSTIGNDIDFSTESSCSFIEDRADEIVWHLEQSQTLMENNPKSNNDRIESLRLMTENLTLKRLVKRKLLKSIHPNSKAISCSKRLRYRIGICLGKIPVSLKKLLKSCEFWYSSLKVIEGHFGSSVASYFKFLRKLFLLNASIFLLVLFFVMIPQLLFRFTQYVNDVEIITGNITVNNTNTNKIVFHNEESRASAVVMVRNDPYKENSEFRLGNIFTGEGFLTNTILFYGYYTNKSLQLLEGYSFNIPASYFFTSALSYVIIFFFLFISVAVSYRKCYIETSGGINNTFSNKIFCGWDHGIATRQTAELKSRSIYIEIKELLDEITKPKRKKSCSYSFYSTAVSCSLNGILLFLLALGGIYSWKYLDQQMTETDTATTMMMWLLVTLVIAISPVLFSLITQIEGFESQSTALYMTLIRTFTLYAVVIAVVVGYRLNRSHDLECWETILGQDMYRLVFLDFIFGLIGTALSEFIRFRIFVKMWEGIGCPEFDIARSTMNLIYNQTLFYVGFYFSPVLSLIITIKMFLTFYIKKWGAIYNCKPFLKPWKAAHAHTVYLSIAFFSFFCVFIAYGYIITSVKTSNCGPFRGEKYMYESVLEEILTNNSSFILTILYCITRPGIVGISLMAFILGVYYMRAIAMARIHFVDHLRHLLLLKAEDRKILLNEISKYTKAQQLNIRNVSEGFQNSHFKHMKCTIVEDALIENERNFKNCEEPKFSNSSPSFTKIPSVHIEENVPNTNINFKQDFNSDVKINGNIFSTEVRNNENLREFSSAIKMDNVSGFELKNYRSGTSESKESNNENEKVNSNIEINEPKTVLLSFNPIFTESIPEVIVRGEDENESSFVNLSANTKKSLPSSSVESNFLKQDFESDSAYKNYLRFQERVPSRISFNGHPKKCPSKKKKH